MSHTIIIRSPRIEEAFAVRRLAYLDSRRPLRGEVLVAFVDDEPLAAISLADGAVVADPFRRTADVVELLRLRAQLNDGGTSSLRRAGGLRPRLAA
ncbi:MAG: hypothetical protein E6G10_21350 [Actinobacteria bacterium]|nr:MAG: hypothetical protein E6G10_21350 [Actinomycetota bacterium]